MSGPENESTPGAGQRAGGAEDRNHHHHPDNASILPGDDRSDEKGLLPDTGAALDFLDHWCGDGPRVLTAIPPDGGKTATATFGAGDRDRMAEWIDARQGRQNIYFTVNRVFGPVNSKPKKSHIEAAIALHVDVDPRAGEPLAAERERAERVLREHDPAPSVIVDSGGGYQGFWLLDAPVVMEGERGDEARHLPVEDRNRRIEVALGGDDCHNIDRIMRLPGTVNLPGEKKRKKGRTPRVARVIFAHWSLRHRLADFEPLAKAATATAKTGPVRAVTAVADVDVSALPVSDRVKALIVTGDDPDDPGRWEDRSRLVLYVLCAMIRAGVSDAEMKAVILDPDFAVSAHVLEQKGADRYADRQIARAHEEQPAPGPILRPLPMDLARACRDVLRPNLRHHQQEFLDWDGAAYVSVADDTVRSEVWRFLETCRVETEKDGVKPMVPKSEMVSGAIDALRAVSHLPPSREEPPLWLDGRSGPDPMELLPTRSGLLHLPTGDLLPATPDLFTRNALDFAHDPDAPQPERWLRFLREVWPGDDEADFIAALQEFMGYLLTPDTSLQKALLLPGPKRSGKGTIGHIMGKLVGEANTVAPSLNSFGRSDFGLEPLLAKQLAIVSDMRLSGRTDEAAVAENLLRITGEDRVSVNRKHRHAVEVTLRTRFVVMTNEVPKFADRSGALVSRFVVLPMRQSFYGREDPDLKRNLAAELPGILLWAVDGWRRVRATHRITQPEAGRDVALQMTDLSSPIPAFVREWCEIGGDLWVAKDRLFAAFREWHREQMGQEYVGKANIFAQDLYSATDQAVKPCRPRDPHDPTGEGRIMAYGGIALRSGFDARPRSDDPPF